MSSLVYLEATLNSQNKAIAANIVKAVYKFIVSQCCTLQWTSSWVAVGTVSEISCISWINFEFQVLLRGCVTQWPQRRQQHQRLQDSATVTLCYIDLYISFLILYISSATTFSKNFQKNLFCTVILTYMGPSCIFEILAERIVVERHQSWWQACGAKEFHE